MFVMVIFVGNFASCIFKKLRDQNVAQLDGSTGYHSTGHRPQMKNHFFVAQSISLDFSAKFQIVLKLCRVTGELKKAS